MAMPEEYQVIRKAGFSLPNIAYFLSRSASRDILELLILLINVKDLDPLVCCLSTTLFRSNCSSHTYSDAQPTDMSRKSLQLTIVKP
jgi:hypothetical protein